MISRRGLIAGAVLILTAPALVRVASLDALGRGVGLYGPHSDTWQPVSDAAITINQYGAIHLYSTDRGQTWREWPNAGIEVPTNKWITLTVVKTDVFGGSGSL